MSENNNETMTERRLELLQRIATMEWDKGRNQLHEAQCVKLKVFKEELTNIEYELGIRVKEESSEEAPIQAL